MTGFVPTGQNLYQRFSTKIETNVQTTPTDLQLLFSERRSAPTLIYSIPMTPHHLHVLF